MNRRHNPFVRGLFDSVEEFVEAMREPAIDVGYAASMDEALGTVAHYRGSVRPHRDQGTTADLEPERFTVYFKKKFLERNGREPEGWEINRALARIRDL